ncbi:M48 family metalloprotease [Sphingomonas canadensis]|uniref:M48 family metalloprotease n=1 Tax=Sphingomonas canadensis TaxID=1219257 RepID=A0ABW3H9C1_9SPHN|nr:M48 family metallopeptidase [Sphingomonas canadensis]MCW3835516.1 M48 family metalloprotease [Sphingomonas canadensis]
MFRRGTAMLAVSSLLAGSMVPQSSAAPGQEASPPVTQAAYVPKDKDERGLWMMADEEERQLRTSNFVIRDPAINAYVRDVLCRTIGQAECAPIRLYVVRTPYFNATSAPNGMIQVWSGLFLRVRNEAQLAAVLAHEYVHYRDRHFLLLWRELRARAGSATFLSMFGLIGSLVAMGQLSTVFSFSRDQESAADSGAVYMLANAGYDTRESALVWGQIRDEADATAAARQAKSRKDKNGGIFATHPPTADRMTALFALSEKVKANGEPVNGVDRYHAMLATLWPSLIDDQIKLNDLGATEFLLASLAGGTWTADLLYARGETYRARGAAGDFEKAAGFYREAMAQAPANPEVRRGLGLSLLRLDSADEGREQLKEYLRLKPDAVDAPMIRMLAGG